MFLAGQWGLCLLLVPAKVSSVLSLPVLSSFPVSWPFTLCYFMSPSYFMLLSVGRSHNKFFSRSNMDKFPHIKDVLIQASYVSLSFVSHLCCSVLPRSQQNRKTGMRKGNELEKWSGPACTHSLIASEALRPSLFPLSIHSLGFQQMLWRKSSARKKKNNNKANINS